MPRKNPLEEFQLSLWRLLSSEQEDRLGAPPERLHLYEREYRDDLSGPERRSTLSVLARSVAKSDIVYVGDDHAVPQSREAFLFLLGRVVRHRKRFAVGLEMVHAEDQKNLDRFLRDEVSETEFLRAIQYWERWGFDWNSYRKVLLLAKRQHLPVLALNHTARGEDALHRRDERAAARIAEFLGQNPGLPLFILFGEQHVSESHLPRRVDEALRREGAECRSTIVHQNATLEGPRSAGGPRLRVARLGERTFRIRSVSPLAALSSHLEWLDLGPRRQAATDREEIRALVLDRTHTVALALSVLLEQESDALNRFEVLLEGEAEEALRSAKAAGLSSARLEHFAWELRNQPASLVPGTPFVFVADSSFPGVCEAAGLLLARGEEDGRFSAEDPLLLFCMGAFRSGLGYFTAKLFDPYRTPKPPHAWLERTSAEEGRQIARWREEFRVFLRRPQSLPGLLESLRDMTTPLRCALSRSTGEVFGTKLYRFFSRGHISPAELRHLFSAAWGPGNGLLPGFLGFLRRGEPSLP